MIDSITSKHQVYTNDFKEFQKRFDSMFEALTSAYSIEIVIDVYQELGIDSHDMKNLNWIYLSYSSIEFTNLILRESNGLPAFIEQLKDQKMTDRINHFENRYEKQIEAIQHFRDENLLKVYETQKLDLPSYIERIEMLNELYLLFIDLSESQQSTTNLQRFTMSRLMENVTSVFEISFRTYEKKEELIPRLIRKVEHDFSNSNL